MSQDEFYKYIETPEFKELLENYESALSSGDLGYIEADDLIDIAEYFHMQGDLEMAEGAAEHCLELFPDDDPALLFLTRMALIDRDDIHKAKLYFDRVQDKEDNLEAIYVRAELMLCDGQAEEADLFLRKKYHDMRSTPPVSGDMSPDNDDDDEDEEINMPLDIAMLYSDHGLLTLADKWMQKASLPQDRGLQVDYWDTWARIHMDEEQYDQAESDWNNLLDINAYNLNAWLQLCDTQFHLGKYNEALQSVEYLLAINSNVPEALVEKVNCLCALKRYDEALQCTDSLEDVGYSHSEVELMQGAVLLDAKQIKAAMQCFSDVVEASDFDPKIMIRIGIIFYEAGLITSAYGMLNTVYEAYESCGYEGCTYDGLAYLAASCRTLEKKEEYEKYLRLAVSYAPLDATNVLGDFFPPGTEPQDYIKYV